MGETALGRKLQWLLAVGGLLTPGMGPPPGDSWWRWGPACPGCQPVLREPLAGTVLGCQSAPRERGTEASARLGTGPLGGSGGPGPLP